MFRRNKLKEKSQIMIQGMVYSTEEESYDQGYFLGNEIIPYAKEVIKRNKDNDMALEGELASAICGAVLDGYITEDKEVGCKNMLIPKDSVSPELCEILKSADIAQGVTDAVLAASIKNQMSKTVSGDEIADAFDSLGIDPSEGVAALISAGIIEKA